VSKDEKKSMRSTMETGNSKCGCADADSRNACCPFTMAELRCVMNKLKIGKAAGADEISNEMVKRLGDRGTAELLRICNMSWINKTVPADWRRAPEEKNKNNFLLLKMCLLVF